ncbi:hypothetical protein B0H14DRAFT_3655889 [Mycena olivaceomarginata]|nr:hypothetical protein B0H14DRAFT_3655889 [Mycena olivaceomarginata]
MCQGFVMFSLPLMANSKLGHAVHPKQAHDTDAAHGGVLASILKQHPNLSAYDESRASPVKLLTEQNKNHPRNSRKRPRSASQVPIGPFFLAGAGFGRVSSHDRLSPSVDALRSPEPPRAPLRAEDSPLKDPATGTRQDGCFFSRDAYKVLSLDTPHQFAMTHAFNTPVAPPDDAQTFLERLQSNASSSPGLKTGTFSPSPRRTSPPTCSTCRKELPILPPSETQGQRGANGMTSTPYRHKGKGKGQELDFGAAPAGTSGRLLRPGKDAAPGRARLQQLVQLRKHDVLLPSARRAVVRRVHVLLRSEGGRRRRVRLLRLRKNNSTASSPRPGTGMESPSLSSVASSARRRTLTTSPDLVIHADGNSANKHTPTPEQDSFSAHRAHVPHAADRRDAAAERARAALGVSNADTGTDRDRDREIVAMQTQLALQTALCGQFETDLRGAGRARRGGSARSSPRCFRRGRGRSGPACCARGGRRWRSWNARAGSSRRRRREEHCVRRSASRIGRWSLGGRRRRRGSWPAAETANLENAGLVEAVDRYKQQLKEHEDELLMLKAELKAQWDHAEKGTDKLEAAEVAKRAAEAECEALQAKVDELAEKMMEIDAGFESQNNHLENDIQELWDVKESLEQEREELLEQVRNREGHVKELQETLQAREDRIVELMQERQYALDNVARLE